MASAGSSGGQNDLKRSRPLAADTIEESSDEEDDAAGAGDRADRDDEQLDIAQLMANGVRR